MQRAMDLQRRGCPAGARKGEATPFGSYLLCAKPGTVLCHLQGVSYLLVIRSDKNCQW